MGKSALKSQKQKPFTDILEQLSMYHDRSSVFNDYLTITVCCLSMKQKEDTYLSIIKNYTKEEVMAFAEAFATMIMWMEIHPLEDPLGDYFQANISQGHNGQFFTPPSICDMMAKIINPGTDENVCDPCCGSGRFFLSAAKINRNRQFYGADISMTCCLMTLINLCLNDLTGEVRHMDSLSMETWHIWRIVRYPVIRVPYIQELSFSHV